MQPPKNLRMRCGGLWRGTTALLDAGNFNLNPRVLKKKLKIIFGNEFATLRKDLHNREVRNEERISPDSPQVANGLYARQQQLIE